AKSTAASLGLELQQFEARGPQEVQRAFSSMAAAAVDAVTIFEDAIFFANTRAIAELALSQRLSSIGYLDFASQGGLIAYGVELTERFRRAAFFVDRVLKGAKPADFPVEQPTRFRLVLNLKTAKALGFEFPPMLLARADEVLQ